MGLIRKQAGLDLRTTISKWRDSFLENTNYTYWVDPDELCDVFNNKKLNIINVRRIIVPHHLTLISGTSTYDVYDVYDLIDGDWVITRHKLSQNEDWD